MTSQTESMPCPAAVAFENQPTLFRNSRLLLAGVLLLGISSGFFSLCALILTLGAAGHLLPLSADAIYSVVESAFMTLSCGLMSLWLLQQTRQMAFNHAQFNAAGIEFCYGSKRAPRKFFLAWADIRAVYTWRLPQGQAYRIDTGSDICAEFTSYTFFRPKKLATLISQRTGCSIERIDRNAK